MDLPEAMGRLYPSSDWSAELNWLSGHNFVSSAREGWNYADGTQAAVIINRFADTTDAASQIGSWDTKFRHSSGSGGALADPADGGMGMVVAQSRQTRYVKTVTTDRVGVYVIEIQVYALVPEPGAAKAMLRQEYARLKAGGA
jgi:hypothetical protein